MNKERIMVSSRGTITIVVSVIALIIMIVVLAVVFAPNKTDALMNSLLGGGGPVTVPEAALPVPGFRYRSENNTVSNVRAMWWTNTPSVEQHPRYENLAGQNDLMSLFSSSWLWNLPVNNGSLQWIGTTSDEATNYSGYCPLGSIVAGVKTFGGNTSNPALATAVVPMCKSIFRINDEPVEGILVADDDPTVHIDTSLLPSPSVYFPEKGWMTANNFLRGDKDQWFGNMLRDQSSRGDNKTPPAFYWEGITLTSKQCDQASGGGVGGNPWKPSGQDNHDAENRIYWWQFIVLYYRVLDPENAQPQEFLVQLPNYQWNGSKQGGNIVVNKNTWTYINTQKPFVPDKVMFDATRPIATYNDNGTTKPLNYGGSNIEIMGMAIKPGSIQLMPGSPNVPNSQCGASVGNCAGPSSTTPMTWNCGQQYQPFVFGLESQENNSYYLNFCYGCSIMNVIIQLNAGPYYPTNYMLSLDTLSDGDTILSTINQWSSDAQLKVIDPTCTNVMMAMDDSGNPVSIDNVDNVANEITENACGSRAKTQCASLPKDDPFCACINAQPIDGATSALGKPFTMHCLSNGDCMKASPLDTWMDYDTANVTLCPKLNLSICELLAKLDATAIVITDSRFKCTNVGNTCPECNAGGGPCKSVDKVGGLVACRPQQPDGQCGDGFVYCGDGDANTGLSTNTIIYFSVGFFVAVIVLLAITYAYKKRHSND